MTSQGSVKEKLRHRRLPVNMPPALMGSIYYILNGIELPGRNINGIGT